MTDQNNEGGEKLYAGKFKTVEELEAGYNSSAKVFQENQDLKSKINEVTAVPESYQVPANVQLDDAVLNGLKETAKTSGLTQAQFDKLALQTSTNINNSKQQFENAKKELGADNINILQDYVKKYYPEKIQDTVLNRLIADKDARAAALAHRETLLSNKAPGMDRMAYGTPNVTRDDVLKAREEMNRRPHDLKAREKYLALTRDLAHAKQG